MAICDPHAHPAVTDRVPIRISSALRSARIHTLVVCPRRPRRATLRRISAFPGQPIEPDNNVGSLSIAGAATSRLGHGPLRAEFPIFGPIETSLARACGPRARPDGSGRRKSASPMWHFPARGRSFSKSCNPPLRFGLDTKSFRVLFFRRWFLREISLFRGAREASFAVIKNSNATVRSQGPIVKKMILWQCRLRDI
jgi:hypothetical protein